MVLLCILPNHTNNTRAIGRRAMIETEIAAIAGSTLEQLDTSRFLMITVVIDLIEFVHLFEHG